MQIKNFIREFIAEEDSPFDSAHASTLVQAADGTVIAAWFGGSWEKAPDTAIWLSRRVDGVWETPRKAADVRGTAMWNPVLFQKEDGSVLLFYKVGAEIPTWKTWCMESYDNGVTFTAPREMVEGDEIGGRGPVKNKPIRLKDGTVLAPGSLEGNTWDAFVDISTDDCRTWEMSQIVPLRRCSTDLRAINRPYDRRHIFGKGVIQPTLWQDASGDVHMFLRSTSSRIFRSDSTDGGRTWCTAYDTGLPNNNSGIDLVRTADGKILLACNPRENYPGMYSGSRTPLSLLISGDNGETFEHLADLETEEGIFCYPSIICNERREVLMTYTWNRRTIVFCRFEYED